MEEGEIGDLHDIKASQRGCQRHGWKKKLESDDENYDQAAGYP